MLSLNNEHDLVHAVTWRVALVPLVLGQRRRTVVSVHGTEVFSLNGGLRLLRDWCLRSVRSLVAVSGPTLDRLRTTVRFSLPSVGVSWNGISFQTAAERYTPTPDFSKIFCLSRLVERKNLVGAMAAVALLRTKGLNLTFIIAGDGECRNILEEERLRLGMQDTVSLPGLISDDEAIWYYRECGIFLHPQIATRDGNDVEGFGLSIADAMSFGCIPIVGNSGGPSDFIRDGDTGFLVDGRDVEAIAGAVKRVVTDHNGSNYIAVRTRHFALTKLTWDAHVRRVLDQFTRSRLHSSEP